MTILFADVVNSSRLSHALDPEAFRDLLARYFGELSAIVRRHGGIVEKYIGDAIMAVFGVPILHEDDALRAVRAAVEMRDSLVILNRELEAGWGVRLASRIGVNTGEVIAGDHTLGHMFVTGEAVNVAKRLEEAAAANEILIGRATHGWSAMPSSSSRAGRVRSGTARRSTPSPWSTSAPMPPASRAASTRPSSGASASVPCSRPCSRQAVRESGMPPADGVRRRGCGQVAARPGVHSRLAGGVTVLHGRCLPYGEGITYWPLAEIVREITRAEGLDPGEQTAATIAALLAGDQKAERIAELAGRGAGARQRWRRHERGDLLGGLAGCSRRWRARDRWSSCWTTSIGPSRPSST